MDSFHKPSLSKVKIVFCKSLSLICPEKGGEYFILIEENSLLPPSSLPLVQLIAVRAAQPPDTLIFSDISFN